MSTVNRFNPIHLIDKRLTIHCRQSLARYRMLRSVAFQYDHPNILTRWTSSHSSVSITPVFKNALKYGNKIAIKDEFGEYSYDQIYNGAAKISIEISKICGTLRCACLSILNIFETLTLI